MSFNDGSGDNLNAQECYFCRGSKFYLNIKTGQYDCKSGKCGKNGNVYTFIRRYYQDCLEQTTNKQYLSLKAKRGIPSQTLHKHGLAFDDMQGRWLIPFKSPKGEVVNLQFYYPDKAAKPDKYNLPGLRVSLYGVHDLHSDGREILLCEGAFDAIALDAHLGPKRDRYDILAVPTQFQQRWAEFFRGRKVRAIFDNDAGGEQHREAVKKHLRDVVEQLVIFCWPEGYRLKSGEEVTFTDGCDVNDLYRDYGKKGLSILALTSKRQDGSTEADAKPANGVVVARQKKLLISHGFQPESERKAVEWIWPHHIPRRTYISFSGQGGTFKSTIAAYIAARYTAGLPLPTWENKQLGWEQAVAPGNVLYLYAEDDRETVEDRSRFAGGDPSRWWCLPAVTNDGTSVVNILESLGEIREEHGSLACF